MKVGSFTRKQEPTGIDSPKGKFFCWGRNGWQRPWQERLSLAGTCAREGRSSDQLD